MSDDDLQPENCPLSSSLHVISESNILDDSSQDEEQQTIINPLPKVDSLKVEKQVQTGPKTTAIKKIGLLSEKSIIKRREPSTSRLLIEKNFETSEKRAPEGSAIKTLSATKPLTVLVSLESSGIKSMESRKSGKHSASSKPSDLARRKLEVELKAAEEIARLKENVIEKRLALELASLDDGFECRAVKKAPSTPLSPPLPDKKSIEEAQKRMCLKEDSFIHQDNMKQERELFYDYSFNRSIPPRPTSGFSRQPSAVIGKILKNDSSSVLTSLRNINLGDKKFNIDKKLYGYNDGKTPSPINLPVAKEVDCLSPGCKMAKKHTEYHKNQAINGVQSNKARMVWKSAMSKIKNKMKSKTPPQ